MIMYAVLLAFARLAGGVRYRDAQIGVVFKRRETSVVLPVPEAAEMMKILPFLWGFMILVPMELSVDCSIRGV